MTAETYCRACNIDNALGALQELRDMLDEPREITIVPDSDALSPVKLLNLPEEIRDSIVNALLSAIDTATEKLEAEFNSL